MSELIGEEPVGQKEAVGAAPAGRSVDDIAPSPFDAPPSAGWKARLGVLHRRRQAGVGTMTIRPGAFELTKRGASRYELSDPYHLAITLPWPTFAAAFLAIEAIINVAFAALYVMHPGSIANAKPGSFSDAFFFSLETLATVGYGELAPQGFYGHAVAAVEIITGLVFTAIVTGLLFVRFSRPRAKLVFADKMVVARRNGTPTLMVRVGNGRLTFMSNASAKLSVLMEESTEEGRTFRRTFDLKLVRGLNPLFALMWTLMHPIDETSPLHGFDGARMEAERVRFFLSIEARDRELASQVYDLRDYGADDVLFGARYADAVTTDEDGHVLADLTRISVTEPDA